MNEPERSKNKLREFQMQVNSLPSQFQHIGQFVVAGDRLQIEPKVAVRQGGLYSFVVSGTPVYIGKTTSGLSTRLNGYLSPKEGSGQSTNIRVNREIRTVIEAGGAVHVFAFVTPDTHTWDGMQVNLAEGLERPLIKRLAPVWNGGRSNSGATFVAVPEESREPQLCARTPNRAASPGTALSTTTGQFLAKCRELNGTTLKTSKRQVPFKIRSDGRTVFITPLSSGLTRPLGLNNLDLVLEVLAKPNPDMNHLRTLTFNSVYIKAIAEASKQ